MTSHNPEKFIMELKCWSSLHDFYCWINNRTPIKVNTNSAAHKWRCPPPYKCRFFYCFRTNNQTSSTWWPTLNQSLCTVSMRNSTWNTSATLLENASWSLKDIGHLSRWSIHNFALFIFQLQNGTPIYSNTPSKIWSTHRFSIFSTNERNKKCYRTPNAQDIVILENGMKQCPNHFVSHDCHWARFPQFKNIKRIEHFQPITDISN